MISLVTVKATGKRYLLKDRVTIVNENYTIDPDRSKVVVWGELASFRGLSSKHTGTKTFIESAVDVVKVEKTVTLLRELFEQGVVDLRDRGFLISRTRKGNVKIHGRTMP